MLPCGISLQVSTCDDLASSPDFPHENKGGLGSGDKAIGSNVYNISLHYLHAMSKCSHGFVFALKQDYFKSIKKLLQVKLMLDMFTLNKD